MTVNQLREQVLTLGFERVMEDESAFINSTNRALRQIFSELCCENKLRIICHSPTPVFTLKEYTHTPGMNRALTLHGKALCFKASGEGSFKLKIGTKTTEESFSSPYTVIRKFISDGAILTFTGPLSYRISDLICYGDITSDDESRIPELSPTVTFDISALAADFIAISKPPKDITGKDIAGYSVMGSKLSLPSDLSGEITVFYRRRPMTVYSDSEGDIDIPAESEWLLPLLVSAYLWLDDDGGRSQYYMQLYREGILQLQASSARFIDPKYNDVLGWC